MTQDSKTRHSIERGQQRAYLGLRPAWGLKDLLEVLRGVDLVCSWCLL